MTRVPEVQDNFTGGRAIDPYRADRDEFTYSKNLDIYYQPGRVRPYRDVDNYSSGQTRVARTIRATNGDLYGLTDSDNSFDIRLYRDDGSPWNLEQNTGSNLGLGAAEGVDEVPMLFEHADNESNYVYWWNNVQDISGALVISIDRYEINGASYEADWAQLVIGSSAGPTYTDLPGPGFSHPLTNQGYFALGNEVYGINKNSDPLITDAGFDRPSIRHQVPDSYRIVSMTHFERYLVVGARSKASDTDKAYFFDLDSPLAYFVKEIPEGRLNSIRNTGDGLVAVCTQTDIDGLLILYTYNGGEFEQQKSLIKRNITGDIKFRDAAVDVRNNTLFFGGVFDDEVGIYRFGLNKYNNYYLTIDRGATDSGNETDILSIEINEDTFTVVHTEPGDITRTENSADYDLAKENVILTSRKFYAEDKNARKEYVSIATATIPVEGESFTPATQNLYVYARTDVEPTRKLLGIHNAAQTNWAEFTVQNTGVTFKDYQYIEIDLEFEGLVQFSELYVAHNILPRINTKK